jgi:sarcosine oxidase, subunit alpha
MPARRLERPLDPRAPIGRAIRFGWEGRTVEGREGEPLAIALLAAGHAVLSRSFRFHRPRGLMCASGACGWCECAVDGSPGQRSCRVPLRDGLAARGEHAWPSVERDVFGMLDAFNRFVTPGFYHHRFLRPHALRKTYLDVIRAFGGRGRIAPGPREPRVGAVTSITADLAVVGAGRAGLAAALDAAQHGARVVILEAEPTAGGHAAWSFEAGTRDAVTELLARVQAAPGVQLITGAAVVTREDDRLVAVVADGLLEILAPQVVAATGSYERPPIVPGGDLPGLMAARTVEWLAVRWGVAAGRRAVVVGQGPEADRAIALLRAIGATVAAHVADDDLVSIRGRSRVTGVQLGAGSSVAADLVVFTARAPNLDLGLLGGAAVEWAGRALRPVVDATGRTGVPWLAIVGSAAGRDAAPVPATPAGDAMACYCEDVRARDVTREIEAGYDDPELLKRRTGGLTGACQGKLCLDRFLGACGAAPAGEATAAGQAAPAGAPTPFPLPTARPPLARIRLADLVVGPDVEPVGSAGSTGTTAS